MKIKMLEEAKGSPDGVTVKIYEAKKEYNMPSSLGKVFVEQMKVGVEVKSKVIEIEVPEKVKIQTPEKVKVKTPEKVVKKEAKPKRKTGRRRKE